MKVGDLQRGQDVWFVYRSREDLRALTGRVVETITDECVALHVDEEITGMRLLVGITDIYADEAEAKRALVVELLNDDAAIRPIPGTWRWMRQP